MLAQSDVLRKPKPFPQQLKIKGDVDGSLERERMESWFAERVAQSETEPVTEVVTLTPVLAALLLTNNASNRPISETNLDRIKRDIIGNRWDFNGETIVISRGGLLNDGQHRVRAVLETGRSIRVVIVFGPARDTRFTLDQGVVRTVGHYLSMNGHVDANSLAAAAANAWCYRNLGRLSSSGKDRPTKSENLLMVEHYKDLSDSLNFVSRTGVGAICTRSVLAFAHWAISRVAGEISANSFFDALITGAGLSEGNPVLYCRNRLIQTKGSNKLNDKAELIFRAWNAYRRGERIERISIIGKKLPGLEK